MYILLNVHKKKMKENILAPSKPKSPLSKLHSGCGADGAAGCELHQISQPFGIRAHGSLSSIKTFEMHLKDDYIGQYSDENKSKY